MHAAAMEGRRFISQRTWTRPGCFWNAARMSGFATSTDGSTAAMWQVRNRDVLYRLIGAGSPIDIYMACVHGDLDLAKRALQEDPDCLSAYVAHDRGDGKFAPDTGGNHYNWTIGHAARPHSRGRAIQSRRPRPFPAGQGEAC